MRPVVSTLVLAVLAVACWASAADASDAAGPLDIQSHAVPLDWADAERTVVGRLRYRGGIVLKSADPRFGGLSALLVDADGGRFVAVTDLGYRISGDLQYDGKGDLAGVAKATIEPLAAPDGRRLTDKTWRDAEALSPAPDGGTAVAFEHAHRLWRYPPGGAPPVEIAPPPDLAGAPANGGIEALTLLRNGLYLAVTEDFVTDRGVRAWIGGDQGWSRADYATGQGFKPTGATTLPDGDVLVLERRYPPIGVRIRRLDAAAPAPGAALEGREIARLEGSLAVDNMEGIDARRGPGGETLVYLLSDDNANPLQRTYLLMFELID